MESMATTTTQQHSESETAEAMFYATVISNPWIPLEHITDKQHTMLVSTDRELLFGGSAGGSKSTSLAMAALQYVEVPTYNALLVRRTYSMLSQPGALLDIMRGWLTDTDAHWNNTDNIVTFPSGAQLKFGYYRNDADKDNYQGSNYHFIGIDELTQFEEQQYLWLMSRNRAPVQDNIPLRIWTASNPGSRGHAWVKARFVTGDKRFIRSRLEDNPFLDYAAYAATLSNLDPVTRKQLLDGNWDIVQSGGYFRREWFAVAEQPLVGTRIRFWDIAATPKTASNDPDYTVGALVSMNKEGQYCIEDIVRVQATPAEVEQTIRQTADSDGIAVAVGIEQEPGASGKQVIDYYRRTVIPDRNLHVYKPTGAKQSRIAIVSSHAEGGNLSISSGSWNNDFYEEAELYPDVKHEDQLDAIASAIALLQNAKGRRRVVWSGNSKNNPQIM